MRVTNRHTGQRTGGMRRAFRALTLITLATFAGTACERKAAITETDDILGITITPSPHSLAAMTSIQFSAVGSNARTGQDQAITPVWSVVSGGGTITSTGMFTAGPTPGTYTNTVMATAQGRTATATVTVTVGPLATITVTPTPQTLATGALQQFTAVGRDAGGNIVSFSPTWSVSAAGGGTINNAGMFTAGNTAGVFTNAVVASSGGISGTATVTVSPGALATIVVTPSPATLAAGATQQFTAVGRDANNNAVAIAPVWTVASGGTIGTSGLFTAGGTAGTFTNAVTATSGGISGRATVIVTSGPLASITVSPDPANLAPNGTQTFTATGRDANGNVVAITPAWSVVAGGGSIVATTGVFTAGATPGTFTNTVRATSGTIAGTATVTVSAPAGPLATLTISPSPANMLPNSTQTFTATGRDANGNNVVVTPAWSVINGGGTINAATGVFTSGAATGTYTNTVRATADGIAATATVNVFPLAGPLLTITVSPNPANVQSNGTQAFTATGRDVNGNVVIINPVWSVTNGGGSINASTGVFTAGAAGGTFANTVRATSGSVSGSATVIVTGPLATIVVTPNPATMEPFNSQTFTAQGRDANGAIVLITPVWSVTNGGGTINSNTGVFTAGTANGTFLNTVRATSGTTSGTATVIVQGGQQQPLVNLGAAGPNGIMAGTAVTCVTNGVINADVSISPGNTLTGFGPCVITGVRHLGDAVAAQGQLDLTRAYNELAGMPCPPANFIVANLGGTTKAAGVYCSATGIGVTGTLTLDGGGDPNATFVFQAGTSLTTAGNIVLINGARAENVYWQVGSSATIGTASQWQGNILALTSITLVDNATLLGRALARNGAVSLGTNNVIILP